MLEVIGFPKLKINFRFLSDGSAAVNKVFGNQTYFGNMKMFWDKSAIGQFEAYVFGRFQIVFNFG